jgi:hypothetical protein
MLGAAGFKLFATGEDEYQQASYQITVKASGPRTVS